MASDTSTAATAKPQSIAEESTVIAILGALSLSHLLNDVMQSLLPAVYPLLKQNYALSFFQIGLITFAFQVTASLLQPLVGLYTDRRPWAYSLLLSTLFTLHGPRVAGDGRQLRRDPGSPPRWSASARRSFIPKRRAWPGWPRAAATVSPSRCFRSAATRARRSARCSRRSS